MNADKKFCFIGAYLRSSAAQAFSLQAVSCPLRRGPLDLEIDIVAAVGSKLVGRERRGLLDRKGGLGETHGALPSVAHELQRISRGVHFHRTCSGKHTPLG